MKYIKFNMLIGLWFILISSGHAATLTMVTKYGATGGLAGNFNAVGNQVNGNVICTANNTYANGEPGCDMSGDAGYTLGATGDGSDDTYSGDLLVRTNDSFEVIAAYSWLGNAGGTEEQVTITGTLPAGKGFIWDGIPGACALPDSTLSADRKTIVCVRKDFDANDVGSYAEDFVLPVKVEGDAVNGSVPGDISLTITEPTGESVTDGVRDGNDANLIKVTASPRWNIDKHSGAGYYTTQYGQTNPDTGETGWIIWYNFSIEVDEVPGAADDAINPVLGNEALQGGSDATVTFTDDLSAIAPNAVLATWSGTGCDMTHSNGDEPYASPNATYPNRSISAPNGPLAVTCAQAGTDVTVTVEHIDGALTDAPIRNRNGGLLPVNRNIAAIGTLKVFIPLSDVEAGEDGIAGNGDDGELLATNCVKDFAPLGISGTPNFNNGTESAADNCRSQTLYSSRGSWSKSFRRGWGDTATQRAQWGGGGWSQPPTDASIVQAGDGTASPGSVWGTYNYYGNAGGTAIADPMICDVIDIETYEMTILDTVDDPGTAIDDTIHAVDINHGWTEGLDGINVEYAIGYIGAWPPNPDAPAGYAVANECNNTSITWYPDYVAAKAAADAAGTGVSKARMSATEIPPSQYMSMRIKHTARSTFLTSGDIIPNNTLLVNYAVYKSSLTSDKYISNAYQPHDASTPHQGGRNGDRLIMQRAKVRILKDMQPTAVSPGSMVNITLTPSFTTDGPVPEINNVTIIDLLPKGLTYSVGSTTGTAGATPYGEPTVIAPATDADCNLYAADLVAVGHPCGTLNGGTGDESILLWDLGMQETGTIMSNLNCTAMVDIDAPAGTLANYTQISSPADDSASPKRIANANTNNSVPSSLLIVKSVQTPLHEINKNSLLNWMQFRVGLRNGSASPLTDLDVIDILPFNGDGVPGSFSFTPAAGTTVDRNRDPATNFAGTFQFDSMSFDDNGECDAANVEYWFTSAAGSLDISPVHAANAIPAGANNWCQGTASGPDAGCGFANADVTAVRTRAVSMPSSATCFVNLVYSTQDNIDGNIYANTAGAKAEGVTNGVLSNTVFAKVYASSIGDTVWFDKNKDGVQAGDASEPGIANVTVNLLDGNGVFIATTTTDGNGNYNFPNLVHGDYVVEVVPPEGYLVTGQNLGGNTVLDSDINVDTNRTDTITLGEDEDNMDIDAGLHTPVISGNIFNDGDGDADVNGAAISAPDGTQLHATLLDANGAVLATTPIAADGTYSFDGTDGVRANTDYSVVLSTTPSATTSDLPANWNNTGQNLNDSGAGNDGTNDGKISVSVAAADVPQIDFGINEKPVANDVTEPIQINLPDGQTAVVPGLNVSDREDGTPTTITIETLPDATTQGVLYYNGNPVTAGQVIPNFDPSLLTVDPINAGLGIPAPTVVFTYTTTDAAGVKSDPATVTMPFTAASISGNLFSDGNGDGNINGTAISGAGATPLYVTLIDKDTGAVVSSTALAADGTYYFDVNDGVVFDKEYTLVLSDTNGSTTANLPTNWNNADGENVNSSSPTGNDGQTNGEGDGSIDIVGPTAANPNIPLVDFAINHAPVANDETKPAVLNPGGTTQATVPALDYSDDEDGTPSTITIKTLPNNALLYYDGTLVVAGTPIPNFDPTKLTIDPNDGEQTVVFTYTTTDAAGVESNEATVTMPFTGLVISGNVFNDGDGDADVNGTAISAPDGTQLHATLLDANGAVLATTPIAADDTYSFDGTDGVTANTPYSVVLATTADASVSDLPANWNNTGENINSAGAGNDGTVDGAISVSVGTANVSQIDFGINHKPVANDVTEPTQHNPGGTTQVVVPNLNITDTEDGTPTTITITSLPTNATLYYDGTPVVAGTLILNFDPTKLTVDPDDGDQTVVFDYTTTDAAGVESDPATVTLPFTGLIISGNVFNDGDANANVNGTPIPKPDGTQLHATLLDANGAVLATTPIATDGSYSFDGTDGVAQNSVYSIVLATTPSATASDLPANWNNTGEKENNTGTGKDASANGIVSVSVGTANVPNNDFGINKKPVANNVTEPTQPSPRGTTRVQVPNLSVSDREDGTPTTVTITTLPSNATLYYNGTPITAGQVIPNFNNALLTVDPIDGDITAVFSYTTTDAAGVTSDPATVTMPFIMVNGSWSGNVSEDTNGNGRGDTPIVGVLITLYVDDNGNGRLDSGETTIAGTARTNANGNYVITNLTPGAYLAVQTQPSGYSNVSEREGGSDGDITNNVINVVAGIVSSGEADIGNDFVERNSAVVPQVCGCHICCSVIQKNISTSEINRNSVNLTWNRPPGVAVNGFILYQNNVRIAIIGSGARSYTVNGLNPNTKYHFRIEAYGNYNIYEFGNIIVETKEKDDYGWLPAIYNILL